MLVFFFLSKYLQSLENMYADLHPSNILHIFINRCCISTLLAQDVYINIYTEGKATFNLVADNW